MADDRIIISIELEDGSVQKGFAKVEDQAEKSGKEAGERFESSFSSGLKRIGIAAAAVGATIGAALFSRRAIQAAAVQEQAVQNLNTSLRLAGDFSEQASQQFQDFATELQQLTTIGDEVALNQLALARNFARSNEEAQELVKVAADLSAATGITLDSAVRNLGKTFSGLTGELGEAVPEIRSLTAEQLKAGEALTVLGERFGGAAQQNVRTFGGAILQLGNAFGDTLEKFGDFITGNPAVIAAVNELTQIFFGLNKRVGDVAKSSREFVRDFLSGLVTLVAAVNALFVAPIEAAFNGVVATIDQFKTVVQSLIVDIAGAVSGLVNVFAEDSPVGKALSDFSESANEQLDQFRKEANESLASIGDTEVADTIAENLGRLRGAIEQADPFTALKDKSKETSDALKAESITTNSTIAEILSTTASNFGTFFENLSTGFTFTKDELKAFNQSFQSTFATGISRSVQQITAAVVKGEDVFAALGKSVLNLIGDLAISVGQFTVATGVSKLALEKLPGGATIAAGLGLIALGTVLKTLAGSGFTGGAGAGEGAASGGGAIAPSDEAATTLVEEDEEVERSTAVTVNVEGTVLDPVGTATQIAELLADVTDSNDIAVNTA